MIWICMLLLYSQYFVGRAISLSFTNLSLPPNVTGPESIAFDARGEGPYTGVADGRVLKYEGQNVGFTDYATTSPFRTKKECDGVESKLEICGRPAGLGFNMLTGEIYVVDSKFGFLVIPPHGGLATQLASGFNGTTFGSANALDIDQTNQIVYFTDSGAVFLSGNNAVIMQSNDTSGKLFKYDIKTKQIALLLSELSGPAGVAVSKDGGYVVVSEFIKTRLRKVWVKGPQCGFSEVWVNLPGSPDNIKRDKSGSFWAAVTIMNPQTFETTSSIGQKISEAGIVEASINVTAEYGTEELSEVHEYYGEFYIGSGTANFVGKYSTMSTFTYVIENFQLNW